ncbi:hypothetical protein LINPERHAP1_LOCUS38295 [Linum perenne]
MGKVKALIVNSHKHFLFFPIWCTSQLPRANLYTVAKFFVKLFLLRLTVLLRPARRLRKRQLPTNPLLLRPLAAVSPPVCLPDFAKGDTTGKLGCGHYFHRSCVDRWFKKLGKGSRMVRLTLVLKLCIFVRLLG